MHRVSRVDWSFLDRPAAPTANASGLARQVVVGPADGAVHTELALVGLAPGGWLARHVHAFEEALYVLQGTLTFELDGRVHQLVAGDYAFIPLGVWHGLGNIGKEPVRLLSLNTPQRLAPDAGRRDTFFAPEPFELERWAAGAQRPRPGDPTVRWIGHYAGTPPQAEALRLDDDVRTRRPAGMDTALLAYSGISVKMLVDRNFGAELLTMFTVDYEPLGAAQAHDHPFEEAYVFLDGEIEAELDGQHYTVRAGDVVFAAVGSVHGFYNTGSGRVRWIETQAPQPPARHAYRWLATWKRFEDGLGR
jgi:quercetin dioxygenase-like cupin family protein